MAMDNRFDNIRSIHALSRQWTIKARVVRLWSAPPNPKTSPHKSIEMVLCDREGYKIGAHVRSPFAVKLVSVLKEDVIGRLCSMSSVIQSPSIDPKSKCVNVDIEDQMRTRLTITLWGTFVDQILRYMAKHSDGPVVIAIQYCKIKDYNGSRTLSNSMYASRMFINSHITEIREFRSGLRPEELTSPINPNIHNVVVPASPLEAAFSELSLSTTQDLFLAGDSGKLLYKIDLMVLDHSGTTNITVFYRDAFNILGIMAMDLRKEQLQVDLSSIDDGLHTPFQSKPALISIMGARRLSFADMSHLLQANI
ncbi:replication protein A 70 kDa DNA-binding subunit C-like [Senna tora]|uniref:Replication protein A 70 kDa DNA-binding subunit C-like n=1 Tax=Senna tora TaxID=362788 RepID=A0A834X6W1_9FABA|nr:replication protein A 70 kDa DNA-binding subunit C-like [Senna tora]